MINLREQDSTISIRDLKGADLFKHQNNSNCLASVLQKKIQSGKGSSQKEPHQVLRRGGR